MRRSIMAAAITVASVASAPAQAVAQHVAPDPMQDRVQTVAPGVVRGDGLWTARLEDGGHVLAVADSATGALAHRRALVSRDGKDRRATALIAVPARRSFVLALDGAPELWEIALDPDAGPLHDGFVHSYERDMEESLAAEEGLFARQRILLEAPVVSLALSLDKRHSVIGTRADGSRVEVNLAVRREVEGLAPE